MKVKECLNILGKASRILKVYSEKDITIEEMLDDIYNSIKLNNSIVRKKDLFEVNKVIDRIKDMEKMDKINFLSQYKNDELLEIIREVGLKVSKNQKKQNIIESIVNYYNFTNLPKNMSKRDMNPNNFFEQKKRAIEVKK